MKFTLFIPTLNECEGMKLIMPRVNPEWVDQILVIDANSQDGTVEYCKAQGYDVHVQKSLGLKNAYLEAFNDGLIKGDVIIAFSPDGNSIPELIPILVNKMKEGEHDMIIASRYKDGAKSEDDNFLTSFGNFIFTNTINLMFKGDYTDAMVMYRAFKTELISTLELDQQYTYWPEKVFLTDCCLMPVLSMRAAKRKLKIGEIPGDEPARVAGKAKLQPIRWGSTYLSQIILEKFFYK